MGLVLVLAAGLWGLGAVLKTPVRLRMLVLGILYVAILILMLVLPANAPLRENLGGGAQPWLVLGGLFAMVFGYRKGLASLRRHAQPQGQGGTSRSLL